MGIQIIADQDHALRLGLTHRAASGGALTARELFSDDLVVAAVGRATLFCGAARQRPYIRWCFLPVG
jgi:hypothetical protein